MPFRRGDVYLAKANISFLQKKISLVCERKYFYLARGTRSPSTPSPPSPLISDQIHHDNQDEEEKDECGHGDGEEEEFG